MRHAYCKIVVNGAGSAGVAITKLGPSCAAGTAEKVAEVEAALKAGTLHVFDTSKFTVEGKTLTEYLADVDGDFTEAGNQNVITNGYFDESNAGSFRSAPYFDLIIDGITNINVNYGE